MKIKTNNVARLILDYCQLTAAEQRDHDYCNGEGDFIRYRGHVYFLNDFMRCNGAFNGWDGYQSDSFFSGVVCRFVDGDHVIMGTYIS